MKRIGIFILLLSFLPALYGSTAGKVRAGNRQYKKGRFDAALEKYREAEISSPNSPAVHFNIGNALYRTEKYDESKAEFQRALASKDKLVRSRAYYNLGNAAFRNEMTEEALECYKKALEINPNDIDAKYNIEYILNRKNMQQKSKDSKDSKDNEDKKDQRKNGQAGKQGREDKDKQNGGRQKSGISKEDAQRILQYYNESDKNNAQKRKMMMPQLPKVDEDW